MVWIYLALWAYFLNATSFVIDKYLLAAPIPRPFVYAFWVAALSAAALLLIPFGVHGIALGDAAVSLVSGFAFFAGLVFLYKSLKSGDVSVGATKTGTFTVIFTYIFSSAILGVATINLNPIALALLLVGLAVLARIGKSVVSYSVISGALFAFSLVLLKYVFSHTDLINGIFWTRMGFVVSALIPLVIPSLRHQVVGSLHTVSHGSRTIFILNKIVAGSGFLLLYYAIHLGNVAVVNSLLGFQFVFIFLLATMLHKALPSLGENVSREVIRSKVIGIILICLGFLKILVG